MGTTLRRLVLILGVTLASLAGLADAATTGFVRAHAPSPKPSTLITVSCSSASWCFALGEYPNSNRSSSLVLSDRWDGRTWRQVDAPSPSNASVQGVSCASRRSCMMVGVRSGPSNVPFAEHWGGRKWHLSATASLPGNDNFLSAVSCRSASACVAVGTTEAQTSSQAALVERWDGQGWRAERVPGSPKGELRGVSCVTKTDCWAVGVTAVTTSSTTPLIVRIGGSGASVVHSPSDAGILSSVSCPTTSTCWAVGDSLIGLTNGQWQTFARAPHGAQMQGISCVTAADCTAVGMGNGVPWAGAWDGSAWTDVTTAPTSAAFQSVSCPTATDCVAAGYTGHGLGRALVAVAHDG